MTLIILLVHWFTGSLVEMWGSGDAETWRRDFLLARESLRLP